MNIGKVSSGNRNVESENENQIHKEAIVMIYDALNGPERKRFKLTNSQSNIYEILTNQRLYQQIPLDNTLFKSDLVIKISVPKINYKNRNQKMELGSIVRKFPKPMYKAYEASFEDLYRNMEEVGDEVKKEAHNDKQLQIRQFSSFLPFADSNVDFKHEDFNSQQSNANFFPKRVPVNSQNMEEFQQFVNINCSEQYTGLLDSFTIAYNTLIYSLQQFCGFKVRSFLVSYQDPPNEDEQKQIKQIKLKNDLKQILTKNLSYKRTIYVLLYLPDSNLIKAANKYHIKKEVDYTQIDPFLNQPMDQANRPIRYHSSVQSRFEQIKNKKNEEQDKIKNEETESHEQGRTQSNRRKTMDRKIGLSLVDDMKGKTILNEVKMSQQDISNYCEFNQQLEQQLQRLIQIDDEEYRKYNILTEQEKNYLFLINRGKFNLGVEKTYIKMKKRRRYFQLLRDLCKERGYRVFEQPLIYSGFKLASKKKKFFARLEQMLIYKQTIVSPEKQLALFNKMQRIKLSYLVLKQHIRVQNMYMLFSQVFALGDEYQKFGQIGSLNSSRFHYHYKQPKLAGLESRSQNQKSDNVNSSQYNGAEEQEAKQIRGGLNGRNLNEDWSKFFVWQTNFNTIRNYLGQSKTFEVFIKTNLIKIFVFLTPMGILFQIAKFLIINPNNRNTGYFPEFWFYIAYMIVITIAYGIFVQTYRRSQINYINNFVEDNINLQFIHEYRGPYMRDSTNDNANTYDQKFVNWKDRFKTYATFTIFFLILCAEIGFYYGMRSAITQFSYIIPSFFEQQFELYRPIHLIGYSIFFCVNTVLYDVFINPFAHWITKFENRPTKQSYVNSENLKLYIFAIGIQMIGPIDLVYIQYSAKTSCLSEWCADQLQAYIYCRYILILFFTFLSTIVMLYRFVTRKKINQTHDNQKYLTYSKRLSLFLQFVYEQSVREPCADIKLIDQTVSLIHFATFLTVFPLGPAISFFSMLIDYNVERLNILKNQQRPIPKSQGFQSYRKIVVAIGHWLLFFNFSQMFIALEWLQYLFPDMVIAIIDPPSPYTLMTLKYCTILIFMVIFQCLLKITRSIVTKFHSVLDKRKWKMLQKRAIKVFNQGISIELKQPKALHSISRTFNYNIKRDVLETENLQAQNQQPNTVNQIVEKKKSRKRKN